MLRHGDEDLIEINFRLFDRVLGLEDGAFTFDDVLSSSDNLYNQLVTVHPYIAGLVCFQWLILYHNIGIRVGEHFLLLVADHTECLVVGLDDQKPSGCRSIVSDDQSLQLLEVGIVLGEIEVELGRREA